MKTPRHRDIFWLVTSRVAAGAFLITVVGAQPASVQQNQIVFVCNRDGVDNICLTTSSGSEIRQITFGKENSDSKGGPRWSPDHRKIAFHQRPAMMKPGEPMDIYTMDPDGRGVRKLTKSDGSTLYRNPAWSPDGSRLAMECGIRNRSEAGTGGLVWQICMIGADGSGLRRLTDPSVDGANHESPDWSPDGKRIAFHSDRDAISSDTPAFRGSDIYVMDADGSNVRRLTVTPPGRTTQNPAWSPDGRLIAFSSTRDGASSGGGALYVIRTDGTAIQQLTHDSTPFGYGHPRWSPDGRRFVFHSNRDGTQGTAAEVELYVIGVDGTGMRRLTNNQLYDGFADW